jgi:hypothetical protein
MAKLIISQGEVESSPALRSQKPSPVERSERWVFYPSRPNHLRVQAGFTNIYVSLTIQVNDVSCELTYEYITCHLRPWAARSTR